MIRQARLGVVGLVVGGAVLSGIAPAGRAQSASPLRAIAARTPSYTVSSSFRQVVNYRDFTSKIPLRAEQKKLLQRNLFVCTTSDTQQLFHIYEHNDYHNLPSFVTTDTVLQLYHVFFDFALRTTEVQSLLPVLKRLTTGMLHQSVATWRATDDAKLKAAALKNVAYFGAADRMLGLNDEIPNEAQDMVRKELALIDAHKGFAQGAIFPYTMDYSQFVPRGHYTRSESLRKFFHAMMWYGLAPFALRVEGGGRADEQIRQGLLWVHALYAGNLQGDWDTIYEPTAFFVGFADDLTPSEWKKLSDDIYGKDADVTAFANDAKLAAFYNAANQARQARIQPNFGRTHGVPAGTPHMIEPPLANGAVQLRFMGQRYVPDSEILQRLSVSIERVFPSGLDVMSVLGSRRAANILDAYPQIYNANNWTGYRPQRSKLTAEFAAVPRSQWGSNLYWGWLYALKALNEPAPAGWPSFMRNTAWQDKSLNTALASWTQLRHDTILYAKQSVVECGDASPEPPFVKGYVEPNVLFYDRLLALTKQSRQGLSSRKLLSPDLKERFEQFEDLLTLLRRISAKELVGQKLTKDEYLEIRYMGGKIEHLTTSVMAGGGGSWELLSQTDKNMALVADVHTGGSNVLEEGVGEANEIYVIVPIEGKLMLSRGAAFSYYEFKQPAADRLTDEKWQAALKRGTAPKPPVWTKSFLAPGNPRRNKPSEFGGYNSGC